MINVFISSHIIWNCKDKDTCRFNSFNFNVIRSERRKVMPLFCAKLIIIMILFLVQISMWLTNPETCCYNLSQLLHAVVVSSTYFYRSFQSVRRSFIMIRKRDEPIRQFPQGLRHLEFATLTCNETFMVYYFDMQWDPVLGDET